jgi:ribosome-binding protein aMBF1 (putative translation factor)
MSKKHTTDASKLINKWYQDTPGWDRMLAEEELKAQIGQRVYALRSEAGLSHEELATRIEITPQTLLDVEAADYEMNALEVLEKICVTLGKPFQVR